MEAARNCGALHTARHALEQGREVFVVPGRLDSAASEGCHDLIRDGAQLVRHVDDILETLGPLTQPTISAEGKTILTPRELNLNEQERELLDLIPLEPGTVDEVLRSSDIDDARVLSTLTVLEMKASHPETSGRIRRARSSLALSRFPKMVCEHRIALSVNS